MPRSGPDRAGRDEKRKVFQKVGLAIREGDGILGAPFPPNGDYKWCDIFTVQRRGPHLREDADGYCFMWRLALEKYTYSGHAWLSR